MSDQLCGLWYLRMMDWQANKIPFSVHNCRGALQTVFDNNVMKFGGGRMGAVNGFRADRDAKDACCIQSQEVWTGTVYSLAAHMMVEGMADQGRCHSLPQFRLQPENFFMSIVVPKTTTVGQTEFVS